VNLPSNRPPGHPGKGDQYFTQLVIDMERLLHKAQRSFVFNTLRLSNVKLKELASVLVEFGEDIHNAIGIWDTLENYNVEFFGIPLPFLLKPNENIEKGDINEHRIQYLMWILYPQLTSELVVSPTHRDLQQLATVVADFLRERFKVVPRGSGIKKFLGKPNEFGWDVKRKLVWLGTRSYLFRNSFWNYIEDHSGKRDIPITDDFICQHATVWSGLGVVDILAALLTISEQQRSTLKCWSERHTAYYRIGETKDLRTELVNVINDKPYVVRLPDGTVQFQDGEVVFGSLVPWNGEWYWSGEQRLYGDITEDTLGKLKNAFLRQVPKIAYRYSNELAEKAKDMVQKYYHDFVKYHGDDLAIYPDGLSLAAELQKMERLNWESRPKEVIAQLMNKHNLKEPGAAMSFPAELVQSHNGVGVYFNPDEGQEIMTGFNDIVSGFKKKGVDLNDDEKNAVRSFLHSESVSAKFVRRLVQQYGVESIESAFLIRSHDEYNLDYLLRMYKGAYYRKRYPRLVLV